MSGMARLTIHDQLLVNLAGWLVCDVIKPSDNFALMVAQLRRVIPNASFDHPLISPLVDAAAFYARTADNWCSPDHSRARFDLRGAVQAVFMARAAAAAAAIWPDEDTPATMEPAHAAE